MARVACAAARGCTCLGIEDETRQVDYGKLRFEQERAVKDELRRAREQRAAMKEIRLRVGISEHDFDVSVERARRLLASGADVRVGVTGLEPQESLAQTLLSRFLAALEDVSMGSTPQPRRAREFAAVVWCL